jgi:hypothetical protein
VAVYDRRTISALTERRYKKGERETVRLIHFKVEMRTRRDR